MELFSKHRLGLALRANARRFYRWEYFWLTLVVIAALTVHLALVVVPRDIILDEVHYINDARSIIDDQATERPEHPPLAKLIIVAGIKMFGDNPWGWRILPILFSLVTLVLFYILCRRLNMSRTAASIAVFLLAFENLNFLMSSLAMLDVYFVTFMVAAFVLYAYQKYISAGVAIGLSGLAKLYGALTGPVVFIHWVFSRQKRTRWFMLTVIFAIVIFFALMPLFDFIIHPVYDSHLNPIERTNTMLSLSGSLTFESVEHPSESPPWEWIYTYKPMPFYYMPHWTAAISFTIWALMVPVFIYMIVRAVKRDEAALFGVSWFAGTYLLWIPLTLISQRVTYIYYFYPTVGAVCLGLGIALAQLIDVFRSRPRGKLKWFSFSAVVFILAAHIFSFLILSPLIQVDFAKLVGLSTIQP
jgi:predicted membrane-bound dolichyl-phosphate-mannose-protein mannosyltransferase